jgi:hypothetical protein
LDDCELDVPRITDGCSAYYNGRPLEANPWPRDVPALFQGWRRGWLDAAYDHDYYHLEEIEKWWLTSITTEEQ